MTYLTPIRVQASRILRVERHDFDTGVITTDDPEDPTFRYSRTWGLDNQPTEGDWLVWGEQLRNAPIVIKKADWRGTPA